MWYVVGPTGAPASLVNTRETSAGPILVNAQGMTLYAFLNDTEGERTAPATASRTGRPRSSASTTSSVLDPALCSTVENPEAGAMLKIGDWPLYTFAGDAAPGDVNGQGVGEVWYAVAPDGDDGRGATPSKAAPRRPPARPRPGPRQPRPADALEPRLRRCGGSAGGRIVRPPVSTPGGTSSARWSPPGAPGPSALHSVARSADLE